MDPGLRAREIPGEPGYVMGSSGEDVRLLDERLLTERCWRGHQTRIL